MEIVAFNFIVAALEGKVKELVKFTRSPIFSESPPRSRLLEAVCSNEPVRLAMTQLQPMINGCQKAVDDCDTLWLMLFGIQEVPAPIDNMTQEARTAIESERHRRGEYFTKRAGLLDKIGWQPSNTDYWEALDALDQNITVEMKNGISKIARCLQKISLFLKRILELALNPPAPETLPPPPPGMYN